MTDKSKINNSPFDDFEDAAASPRTAKRPVSGILHEIGEHLTELLRSEVRLARAEVTEDLTRAAKASLFLVVSGVLVLYALGFVLLGAVYALSRTMPDWGAALIVGVGVGAIALAFLLVGRQRMKLASLKPRRTIQSIQENVTWLKTQTK